jgi:hypothetical protein
MGLLNPLNPLLNSIIVYIIIIVLLLYNKPNLIYDKKIKKFKQFGMDKGKSILSLPVLALVIAMCVYLFFSNFDKTSRIMQKYERELTLISAK